MLSADKAYGATASNERRAARRSLTRPTATPPALPAAYGSPGRACSLLFLRSYAGCLPPSVASSRDSVSAQTPFAPVVIAASAPEPHAAAPHRRLNFAPDSRLHGHPLPGLAPIPPRRPPRMSSSCPGYAAPSSADDQCTNCLQSGKSTYRKNTQSGIAPDSCTPAGTLPDKYPARLPVIPSDAPPAAALDAHSAAPVLQTPPHRRSAPRGLTLHHPLARTLPRPLYFGLAMRFPWVDF